MNQWCQHVTHIRGGTLSPQSEQIGSARDGSAFRDCGIFADLLLSSGRESPPAVNHRRNHWTFGTALLDVDEDRLEALVALVAVMIDRNDDS